MRDLNRFLGLLVMRASQRPAVQRYGLAILLPIVAVVGTSALTQIDRAPFFTPFTLAVIITSAFGGTKPGLVTVAVSVFINVVASPPFLSLHIASRDDAARIIVFGCIATVIALFTGATGELQGKVELERARLSITLACIGDAVIATDASGDVTFMNAVAEAATGWRLDDAAGLPLETVLNIVNETSRAKVDNPVRKVLEHGKIVGLANHTILIRRDGSEIPIDDSAAPIRDSGGTIVGVVLVFRDITEAKLSQTALLKAEKLASVGRLASTIAHEINNPLEAVSNLLYIIAEDSSTPETVRSHALLAQSELGRAAEITKQTLSFHKGENVASTVPLHALVESVVNLYATRATTRNVAIRNEVASELAITAVSSQIRQLVSNMVTNALDAMPNGGELRIAGELAEVEGVRVVRMKFADTGVGIEPAILQRIFEPFFTTKKDVGTGLGLWVSQRIVEDHDGEIAVESQKSGTTFTVTLPQGAVKSASVR